MQFILISTPWTKFTHLVSKKFRKIYFVASNGRDGNWNSEDYITTFWRGSEGVVKTGLVFDRLLNRNSIEILDKDEFRRDSETFNL